MTTKPKLGQKALGGSHYGYPTPTLTSFIPEGLRVRRLEFSINLRLWVSEWMALGLHFIRIITAPMPASFFEE